MSKMQNHFASFLSHTKAKHDWTQKNRADSQALPTGLKKLDRVQAKDKHGVSQAA